MHVATVAPERDQTLADEIRAASSSLTILGGRGFHDVRTIGRLLRLVRKLDIDVIHTHLAVADVSGGVAGALTRIPVVTSLHSVAADRRTHPPRRRIPAAYATRRLATEVLAVSDAVKASQVSELGIPWGRVRVVRNVAVGPLSLPRDFRPEAKRAKLGVMHGTTICMAARLASPKDHYTLLQSMVIVRERRPDVTLLVAGDGHRRAELEALTERLGLGSGVWFLGTRADVPELLCAVDIVCNITHEAEGLSITVLDALSLGRPVVATNIPSVAEAIEDGRTGFLVPPRDAASTAKVLLRLIEQPQLRKSIGERARTAALASSDPRQWWNEFEETYRRLANRRG